MNNGKPALYTPSQVQKMCGFSVERTYKLFHSETFPSIKIGKRYYVTPEAFEKWLHDYEGKEYYL